MGPCVISKLVLIVTPNAFVQKILFPDPYLETRNLRTTRCAVVPLCENIFKKY